jgi:hypothetical protein
VERREVDVPRISGDTEATISHFIPSVELKGSRGEKLQKLDILIRYLEQLRRNLAPDTTEGPDVSREPVRPPWGWFSAGIGLERSSSCC